MVQKCIALGMHHRWAEPTMLMFLVISASMCGYFSQEIGEIFVKEIEQTYTSEHHQNIYVSTVFCSIFLHYHNFAHTSFYNRDTYLFRVTAEEEILTEKKKMIKKELNHVKFN